MSSTSALAGWVIVWFLPSVRARAPISPHPQGTRLVLTPEMHLTLPGWSGDIPWQILVEAMPNAPSAHPERVMRRLPRAANLEARQLPPGRSRQ
jgi:hypothetical protein